MSREIREVRVIVQIGTRWNPNAERTVEMKLTLGDLSANPYLLNDLVRPMLESCISEIIHAQSDAETDEE